MQRDAWLLDRRNGITATEVAKLSSYKSPAARLTAIDRLADEKLNPADDRFVGGAMAWGKEREPVLEEWANFAFGFVPESRIAWSEDDRQHLASVDGWRVDKFGALHLAEFKTSGVKLTYDLLLEKGYVDQVLWQMHVTGAVDALVLWEERLTDGDGQFYGGERGTILVERDGLRIAALVKYANQFLVALLERTAGIDGSSPDPMLDDIVSRLQDAKATVAELDPQVRDMMSRSGMTSAKTVRFNVSYEAADAKQVLDQDAFFQAHKKDSGDLVRILAEKAAYGAEEIERITALQAVYTKLGPAPKPTLRITERK